MRRYKRAYIEISNVCNLKCSFCPPVERAKQVMDVALFQRIIHEIAPFTAEVCLHLMGEPLHHPHFEQMIEVCAEAALPVNLTTNGLLLAGERQRLALAPIVRQVNISLHSFAANFGSQNIQLYLDRMLRFVRLALAERPDAYINLRLWGDLHGPTDAANAQIRERIEREFNVDLACVDVRRRKRHPLSGRAAVHFDSAFTWPSLTLPFRTTSGFCHGLSSHFGVHADGTVVPCCLDKEAVINLGSCQQKPVQTILASERAERMRAGFARGSLTEDLCRRCSFVARFDLKARRLIPAQPPQEKGNEARHEG